MIHTSSDSQKITKKIITVLILPLILISCRLSTDELAVQVRENISTTISANNVIIKNFTLIQKGGNEYRGVLTTREANGEFNYDVEVIYDGKNFSWQIKNNVVSENSAQNNQSQTISKITKENYEKIKEGMSYDSVVSILGKPTDELNTSSQEMEVHSWRNGGTNIILYFQNKYITMKSGTFQ